MRRSVVPFGFGLMTVFGLVWWASRSKQGPQPKPDPLLPLTPGRPPVKLADSDATDDVTALARMLESETTDRGARIVIGWMAIQTARRRNLSLYERLTSGKGYGPQVKDGLVRYASTAKKPTNQTRELASLLLSDLVKPSEKIRELGHSAWVEDLYQTEKSASDLLRKQTKPADFGGIWAKIRGTRWYLYNSKKPPLTWETGSAAQALAAVPSIDPLDPPLVA